MRVSHSVKADEMIQLNYVWLENNYIKPVTIHLPAEHLKALLIKLIVRARLWRKLK